MSLPNSSLSLFLFLSLFPSLSSSLNISQVLSQYPAYSSYSNYLTQTQLADEIDKHQPITVLVVDNSGISPLSGRSMDVIKKVLSIHVLLDYYDVQKFQDLRNGFAIVTTLYQTTGYASSQLGFLNVSSQDTGTVTFTSPSAGSNSSVGATLVKSVASTPYNLSIVQISTVIMPPALLNPPPPPSSSPKPAPAPGSSPVPPAASPAPPKAPAPVPARSPVPPAASPVPARSPAPPVESPASGPEASPSPMMAPGSSPMAADAPADAPADGSENGVTANPGINMGLAIIIILVWTILMQ